MPEDDCSRERRQEMKLTNELLNKKRDDLCRCEEITHDVRRENALKELLFGSEKYSAYTRGVSDAIEAVKNMLEEADAEDAHDKTPVPAAPVKWEAD